MLRGARARVPVHCAEPRLSAAVCADFGGAAAVLEQVLEEALLEAMEITVTFWRIFESRGRGPHDREQRGCSGLFPDSERVRTSPISALPTESDPGGL